MVISSFLTVRLVRMSVMVMPRCMPLVGLSFRSYFQSPLYILAGVMDVYRFHPPLLIVSDRSEFHRALGIASYLINE
jgi:hypothetical protein